MKIQIVQNTYYISPVARAIFGVYTLLYLVLCAFCFHASLFYFFDVKIIPLGLVFLAFVLCSLLSTILFLSLALNKKIKVV